jgi:hypothetical protein
VTDHSDPAVQMAASAMSTEQAPSTQKAPGASPQLSLMGSLVLAIAVALGLLFAFRSSERPRDMRLPEPEPRPALLDSPPLWQQPSSAPAPKRRD